MMPKFTCEFLKDLVYDDTELGKVISDTITDTSRWSVHHELVFELGGEFFRVDYSTGATEQQDERPFDNEGDMVECVQVYPVTKTITVYE